MQRILDLLLNEVKADIQVIRREKNKPDLRAKHGVYKARENTPGRIAYEKERTGRSGEQPISQGRGKPDITYAEYAAKIPPTINKRSVPTSELDRMSNRGVKTSKPVSQAARSALGGKPVTKDQAVNIMGRKRDNLRRRGAMKRATPGGRLLPVMTSKPIKDHTEYFDRLTSLLLGEAKVEHKKVKPNVLARVKHIKAIEKLPFKVPSDGGPRPGSGEVLPDAYAAVGSGGNRAGVDDPGMDAPNPTTTTRRKFKA